MSVLFLPFFAGMDGNGLAMAGAKLYFYKTGTVTPQDTYTDSGLGTPNANPVVADGNGLFPPIYFGSAYDYKTILTTSGGTVIATRDPVPIGFPPADNSITTAKIVDGAVTEIKQTLADNTTWNVATTRHGYVPKAPNVATQYLDGTGAWSTPGTGMAAPVTATYATNADLATLIPGDDTIPQVGEGTQVLSQAFTATTAAHRIRVSITGTIASATGIDCVCCALFVDGASNAVAAEFFYDQAADRATPFCLIYEAVLAAGAHTYTVRVGGNGNTCRMNGGSGGRFGGGIQVTRMNIEELAAP